MDKEVHSTILNLLREFQSDGYFLEDVEIEPLARLMYNAVNGVFYRWLGDDIMTQAQSFEQMAEHLAILLPPMASKRRHKSRSAERRVGKEWVSTSRSRWSPYH